MAAGNRRWTLGCLLLLGLLAVNLALDPGSRRNAVQDDAEVTRYSLSLLNRELISFSITRKPGGAHE